MDKHGVEGGIFLKMIMNAQPKLKPKVADNGKYTTGIFIVFMLLMMSSLSLTGFLLFLFTDAYVSSLPLAFRLALAHP